MPDIYALYRQLEQDQVMLSFKGSFTPELLTGMLHIVESKLAHETPVRVKKKVFNVLVECLQNLYQHIDSELPASLNPTAGSGIFMIGKKEAHYFILTGNFIPSENVQLLRQQIDEVNGMNRDQLRKHHRSVLNNGQVSFKGGGGLGIIDIARKSGQKLEYRFLPADQRHSFFSLHVKITS